MTPVDVAKEVVRAEVGECLNNQLMPVVTEFGETGNGRPFSLPFCVISLPG